MTATYGNGTSRGRRLLDDELTERPISKGIVPSSAMPLKPQTPQTPRLKKAGAVSPTAAAQTSTVGKRARYYDPEDRRQQRRGAAFGATSAAAGFTAARAFDADLVRGARPAAKNGLLVRNRSASVRLPGSRVGLLKLTSPKRLGVGALAGGGAIAIHHSNRGSGNKRWR